MLQSTYVVASRTLCSGPYWNAIGYAAKSSPSYVVHPMIRHAQMTQYEKTNKSSKVKKQ